MTEHVALDATRTAADQDEQTVDSSGQRIEKVIEGVRTFAPVNHVDHRGRVFEIYPGDNDFWTDPVIYSYAFTVRAHQTKGWGLHLEKDDRYTLIQGEVMVVLYDARLDSPTHGLVQRVYLSEQGTRQLRIPTGVWHLSVNLGPDEVFLINFPTAVYHHERPDRLLLPWYSPQIPVDLEKFFPIQTNASLGHECT